MPLNNIADIASTWRAQADVEEGRIDTNAVDKGTLLMSHVEPTKS